MLCEKVDKVNGLEKSKGDTELLKWDAGNVSYARNNNF